MEDLSRNLRFDAAARCADLPPRAVVENDALMGLLSAVGAMGIMVLSHTGRVLMANAAATELLGRSEQALLASPHGIPLPVDRELQFSGDRVLQTRSSLVRLDGVDFWLVTFLDVTIHRRRRTRLEALLRRARAQSASLERLASHDPLTQVLNRRGLAAQLEAEQRRRTRSSSPLAAILLDCDDFKRINESFGHAFGDSALLALARSLRGVLRPSDHLGRVGGDEFLVLLPDTRLVEARIVAERLRLAAGRTVISGPDAHASVTVSMGVESVSEDAPSIESLIRNAERALQRSKRGGKNRTTAGAAPFNRDEDQARELLRGLRSGADYHASGRPIVSLADESLAGWDVRPCGPEGSFRSPTEILRLTPERELLAHIDLACLRVCAAWPDADCPEATIHIGVEPATLLTISVERILAALRGRAPVHRYCLELSEQMFIGEPSAWLALVKALKGAGATVAIRELTFARGSFESLILLEPDVVKLDASLVRACAADKVRDRELKRLASAIRTLDCRLYGEDVNSDAELDLVRSLGAVCAQGRLWTRSESTPAGLGEPNGRLHSH